MPRISIMFTISKQDDYISSNDFAADISEVICSWMRLDNSLKIEKLRWLEDRTISKDNTTSKIYKEYRKNNA